jgi:hypothetical protein
VICDNALVTAFAMDRSPVDAEVVLEVCRDFDFAATQPFDDAADSDPDDVMDTALAPEGAP